MSLSSWICDSSSREVYAEKKAPPNATIKTISKYIYNYKNIGKTKIYIIVHDEFKKMKRLT